MDKTPIIDADIGDGETRRFFLGRDEIRLIEQETGAGFYALFLAISNGQASLQQVERVVRLALIGGGLAPDKANGIAQYYCSPPRPLKTVFVIAHRVLEGCWNGVDDSKGDAAKKPKLTAAEIDGLLRVVESNFIRSGYSFDLSGLSLAEVLKLHDQVFGVDDKPSAPDEDTFNAIKKAHKK